MVDNAYSQSMDNFDPEDSYSEDKYAGESSQTSGAVAVAKPKAASSLDDDDDEEAEDEYSGDVFDTDGLGSTTAAAAQQK
jgi:hypothetical protein